MTKSSINLKLIPIITAILVVLVGIIIYVNLVHSPLSYTTSLSTVSLSEPQSIKTETIGRNAMIHVIFGAQDNRGVTVLLYKKPILNKINHTISFALAHYGGSDVASTKAETNMQYNLKITDGLELGNYKVNAELDTYTIPPGTKPIYLKTLTATFRVQ